MELPTKNQAGEYTVAGDDTIAGETGNDTLWGGAGSDGVWGEGADRIIGGDGEDTIEGGAGETKRAARERRPWRDWGRASAYNHPSFGRKYVVFDSPRSGI